MVGLVVVRVQNDKLTEKKRGSDGKDEVRTEETLAEQNRFDCRNY